MTGVKTKHKTFHINLSVCLLHFIQNMITFLHINLISLLSVVHFPLSSERERKPNTNYDIQICSQKNLMKNLIKINFELQCD